MLPKINAFEEVLIFHKVKFKTDFYWTMDFLEPLIEFHYQPINVPTTGAQTFLMDYI
jgi:hypothetical protein